MDNEEDWYPPLDELRAASMQAQFERLQKSIDAFVATLPLPVRIFGRMVGPYGLRFPWPSRRRR